MSRCEKHDKDLEWIPVVERGVRKRVLRCPDCHAGIPGPREERKTPMIKFAQNWHRERAWTDAEKRLPYGKPRRPQW